MLQHYLRPTNLQDTNLIVRIRCKYMLQYLRRLYTGQLISLQIIIVSNSESSQRRVTLTPSLDS